MTCSLQTYRIRIGTFQTGTYYRRKSKSCTRYSNMSVEKTKFVLTLLIYNYCLLALSFPTLLELHPQQQVPSWQQQHHSHGSYTIPTTDLGHQVPGLVTKISSCSNLKQILNISDSDYSQGKNSQSKV